MDPKAFTKNREQNQSLVKIEEADEVNVNHYLRSKESLLNQTKIGYS